MDFYLPDAKIALFVDGTIWHADPRLYKEHEQLFFSKKISRTEAWKKVTAKEVWLKDARHNSYLETRGFIVIRFWEKEIIENIDKCIQLIKSKLSRRRSNSTEARLGSGEVRLVRGRESLTVQFLYITFCF